MSRKVALAVSFLALLAGAPAAASEGKPTLSELEPQFVCPTCETTLDQSDAPVARRMKTIIRRRIAAGDSESEIRRRMVNEFGPRVLAAPPKRGFDLVAWLAPLGALGIAGIVVAALAWRWTRARPAPLEEADPAKNGRVTLDPELERRLDEELARFE